MPRDALWVLPSGATTVVVLDDVGNLMEPIPEAVRATLPEAEPEPEPTQKPLAAPPPEPFRHKHGRHNNRR